MAISLESFFADANDRGQAAGKQVYCHIVGLGLGVWQIHKNQENWFIDVYGFYYLYFILFVPSF
jgi:hypothetical protein